MQVFDDRYRKEKEDVGFFAIWVIKDWKDLRK